MAIITHVALHPSTRRRADKANRPITRRLVASSMMTTMIGALDTPFTTALQNRALIGSTCVTLSRTPAHVAIAIVA
jgi:hypothetical protein